MWGFSRLASGFAKNITRQQRHFSTTHQLWANMYQHVDIGKLLICKIDAYLYPACPVCPCSIYDKCFKNAWKRGS